MLLRVYISSGISTSKFSRPRFRHLPRLSGALLPSKSQRMNVSGESCPGGTFEALLFANRVNNTALRSIAAPGWVSSPGYRGTSDIIWSCSITIVACIYTALHLNVPSRTSWGQLFLYKGKWVLAGVFMPELGLMLAISQFLQARTFVAEMSKLQRERKASEVNAVGASSPGSITAKLRCPLIINWSTLNGLKLSISIT
jgi:hypothetical protein